MLMARSPQWPTNSVLHRRPPALPHRARRHGRRRRWRCRGCSTDRVEKLVPVPGAVRGPGARRRHLVRQHLHRVPRRLRRARAHARRPRGQARGQPRAPDQPGQALLPRAGRAPGPVQPRPDQGPDGAAADGGFAEITWDDAIARLAAKLGEAGNQVAVISGAGRGTFSDLLAEWTAALGGRLVRYEPLRPRAGARRQPPGLRPRPASGARLRRGQVHRLLRRRLPGDLGLADRASARASPGPTASPRAMSPSSSMPPRAWTSPASTPTSGTPIKPGSEAALALAMANVLVGAAGR